MKVRITNQTRRPISVGSGIEVAPFATSEYDGTLLDEACLVQLERCGHVTVAKLQDAPQTDTPAGPTSPKKKDK